MMKVMFVDDRPEEVFRMWKRSECEVNFELVPFEEFDSVERTVYLVNTNSPDIVLVGHGLSRWPITGSDVVKQLRREGFQGFIVANSGGGAGLFRSSGVSMDASAERNPQIIKQVLHNLTKEK